MSRVREERYPLGTGREEMRELGRFVAAFDWEVSDARLKDRLTLTLLDTLSVTVAGARTPEMRALAAVWMLAEGPARLLGTGRDVAVDAAAYLNGTAAVVLELDEGNKYARGHPACHTLPAALAVAQGRGASGADLAAALVVGYETASRFGYATRLHAGVHPHGNWGAVGAAAAVARLLGLDAEATAIALDAACGLAGATPWECALAGSSTRNAWVGAANLSGISAARMASAGVARFSGAAQGNFGCILGEFEPEALTEELGKRFYINSGYFKRHASCAFTHPPVDALAEILTRHPEVGVENVESVLVETYRMAATLDGLNSDTPLAAKF